MCFVYCGHCQLLGLLDDTETHCILNVFPDHRDAVCREKYYKLLHVVWDRVQSFGGGGDGGGIVGPDLVDRVRQALIKSLSDDSAIVRRQAHEFWDSSDRSGIIVIVVVWEVSGRICCVIVSHRLSERPHERVLQLLGEMYGPHCEKQWIHYAVQLLTSLSQ